MTVVPPSRPDAQGLQITVLGPVAATYAGKPVSLGGPKQRALLAVLALRDGDVVSVGRLVLDLWGEDSPPSALKMVQVFASRLRASIGDVGGDPAVIQTHSQGYALRVAAESVDVRRAETLAAAGRAALSADPVQASDLFAEALSLWTGSPLAGTEALPFAPSAGQRLAELRLTILGDRIDADLAAGRHAHLIGELRETIAEHPLREQPHAQLMLALYRSGRQVEALEVFAGLRDRLREEVALDPSAELRRLEHAMLNHDTSLRPPSPRVEAALPARALDEVVMGDRPRAADRLPQPSGRRAPVLRWAAAVVLVAAVAAAAVLALTSRGEPRRRPTAGAVAIVPDSVAVIRAENAKIVADVPVGSDPGPVAVEADAAWVGNQETRTVSRVSLSTYRVVETYGLAAAPVSITAAGDRVWVGLGFAGTLSRILPAYDQISAPFAPAVGQSGLLAVAATSSELWVGLADDSLLDLDPSSLRLRHRIAFDGHVLGVAAVGDQVWTIQFRSGDVDQVSATAQRIERRVQLHGSPQNIALGDGSVWVTTQVPNRLWRLDVRTGAVTSSTPLSAAPTALVVSGENVWVAESLAGQIARVDASSRRLPATIDVGHPIGGLAVSANTVFATVDRN